MLYSLCGPNLILWTCSQQPLYVMRRTWQCRLVLGLHIYIGIPCIGMKSFRLNLPSCCNLTEEHCRISGEILN